MCLLGLRGGIRHGTQHESCLIHTAVAMCIGCEDATSQHQQDTRLDANYDFVAQVKVGSTVPCIMAMGSACPDGASCRCLPSVVKDGQEDVLLSQRACVVMSLLSVTARCEANWPYACISPSDRPDSPSSYNNTNNTKSTMA